jgi:hypothetical protein
VRILPTLRRRWCRHPPRSELSYQLPISRSDGLLQYEGFPSVRTVTILTGRPETAPVGEQMGQERHSMMRDIRDAAPPPVMMVQAHGLSPYQPPAGLTRNLDHRNDLTTGCSATVYGLRPPAVVGVHRDPGGEPSTVTSSASTSSSPFAVRPAAVASIKPTANRPSAITSALPHPSRPGWRLPDCSTTWSRETGSTVPGASREGESRMNTGACGLILAAHSGRGPWGIGQLGDRGIENSVCGRPIGAADDAQIDQDH